MSRLALKSGAVYIYLWTARRFPFSDGVVSPSCEMAACLVTTRGGRRRATTLQRQCWRRRRRRRQRRQRRQRRRRRRRSRRLQTFHLELFSELQFLVFVALPYIIPAVNGNRKFRRDNRRHSRRRSDRSSPPTLRFFAPPIRFLWGTWSRETTCEYNTVTFNRPSKNCIKFVRDLERSYTEKDSLEIWKSLSLTIKLEHVNFVNTSILLHLFLLQKLYIYLYFLFKPTHDLKLYNFRSHKIMSGKVANAIRALIRGMQISNRVGQCCISDTQLFSTINRRSSPCSSRAAIYARVSPS